MHAAADAFGAVGADGIPGIGADVIAVAVGGAIALHAAYLRAGEAHHQGGDKKQDFHPPRGKLSREFEFTGRRFDPRREPRPPLIAFTIPPGCIEQRAPGTPPFVLGETDLTIAKLSQLIVE